MTAAAFAPWSSPGCTYVHAPGHTCGTQDTTTVSWLGRRCADHPPQFDPTRAVHLAVDGFPAAAMAYCRGELP